MALIKCPECGKEISDKAGNCPHCGCPIGNKTDNNKHHKKKLLIIAAVVIIIIIAIVGAVFGILINVNPVKKYSYYFGLNKSEKATEVYNDKINGDNQLIKELSDQQDAEMDDIYKQFKQNKISYKDAKDQIQKYMEYTPSKRYASGIKENIESLNDSRTAYKNAKKAEEDGDIETALKEYKDVIEDDESYTDAQKKIESLQDEYKIRLLDEAKKYIKKKKYDEAIADIDKIVSVLGESDDLTELKDKYTKMKSEQYAKIIVADKTVTPKDVNNWIFSNYVNFVFDITNNSDKAIKGIEGKLTVSDLFGKKIIDIECDFTGHTINSGETYRESDLCFECNEFVDEHMKLYNTDYSDLKFQYNISKIVYSDGTKVTPK